MRGRWGYARVALLVMYVASGLVVQTQRAAADTDLLQGKSVYYASAAYSTYVASRAVDGNDATGYVASAHPNAKLVIDAGAAVVASSYEAYCSFAQCLYDYRVLAFATSADVDAWVSDGNNNHAVSGSVLCVGDATCPVTYPFDSSVNRSGDTSHHAWPSTFTARYFAIWWGTITDVAYSTNMNTFSVFGSTVGGVQDYVYNLVASHPFAKRVYTWQFRTDFTWGGTWTFKDSGGSVKGSGTTDIVQGDAQQCNIAGGCANWPGVQISCWLIVCGHDTYTLTINDTVNSITVSYDIDSDVDGSIVGAITAPHITLSQACYQATTAQCDAVLTTVGLVKVTFTFTGDVSKSYNVFAGREQSNGDKETDVSGAHNPGTWTVFFDGTGRWDTFTCPMDSTRTCAKAYVGVGAGQMDFAYMYVYKDGTGGNAPTTAGANPPIASPPEACNAQTSLVCAIGSVFGIGKDAVLESIGTILSPLKAKQPFAFIAGAADAIGTQLSVVTNATSSTSSCPGYTFTMPTLPPATYTGMDGATHVSATPAPSTAIGTTVLTYTALKCADVEPVMGTSLWQGLRTVMGPAIYMMYGWRLVKEFRPRPTMNG